MQELEEETGELPEPIYQEMSVVPGKNTASAPEEPNTQGRCHSHGKENIEVVSLLKIDNKVFLKYKRNKERLLSIYTIHRLRVER